MALSTPIIAWQASLLAATATAVSGALTVTANLTGGWEFQLPIAITWKSGVSADAVVNAYPSNDGGNTYDTNPVFSTSIARSTVSSTRSQTSIRLPVGQYAITILNSGPSTGSASIGTAMVITGINIV